MIDKKLFYQGLMEVHLFGVLSTLQVRTIEAVIDEWDSGDSRDNRQLAYVFGTAYHECFNPKHPETRLTPMDEFGGEEYLKSKQYYPYYGRGLVQLTWKRNYERFTTYIGIDIVNHPEYCNEPRIAAKIAVYGMVNGSFTGLKLSRYVNAEKCDWIGARKVINGLDKAEVIGGYAQRFLPCLHNI